MSNQKNMSDLKTRTVTSLVLIGLLGSCFYFIPAQYIKYLFFGILSIGIFEASDLLFEKKKSSLIFFSLCILTIIFHSMEILALQTKLLINFCSFVLLLFILPLGRATHSSQTKNVAPNHYIFSSHYILISSLFYISFSSMSFIIQDGSKKLFLTYVLLICIQDSFAYLGGKLFSKYSKKKLKSFFPSISASKTFVGFLSGFTVSILVFCLLFSKSLSQQALSHQLITILWGCAFLLSGVAGDLFFSSLKRYVNTKDSSHILPGHGGVLDRIDSLMISAPIFCFGLAFIF